MSQSGRSRSIRSAQQRAHGTAVGYHLLVALLFTSCLPVALARAMGARTDDAVAGGPIGTALDTARVAAAQAFSLPG